MTGAPTGDRLLIFAREPIAGQVKTRLIPALGPVDAARLYRRMLDDTLAIAAEMPGIRSEVWIDGQAAASSIVASARILGIGHAEQRGPDLGRRMYNALRQALDLAVRAVLIGTDCPMIDRDYLEAAFAALSDRDIVIGPAADGGYVLIGARRVDPWLFDGLPWGSDRVLAQTRDRLHDLGWSWSELATLIDVDRPGDLAHFPQLAAHAHHSAGDDPQRDGG